MEDPGASRVVTLTRRALSPHLRGTADRSKIEEHVIDFDRLGLHAQELAVDQIICALGTTMRKAGSQPEFRKVDFDYPLAIAHIGLQQGCHHFLLVSALGANAGSRIFYSRVKGELEVAICALPFRSRTIVRPSLLLGPREEFRLGEKVVERLAFLMPKKYKPVSAIAVAHALVAASREDRSGTRIIESAELRTLAVHSIHPSPDRSTPLPARPPEN
ncbi:MAG: hypothetical protein ACREV1_11020 [Gammaproteobacteria bacterium]